MKLIYRTRYDKRTVCMFSKVKGTATLKASESEVRTNHVNVNAICHNPVHKQSYSNAKSQF